MSNFNPLSLSLNSHTHSLSLQYNTYRYTYISSFSLQPHHLAFVILFTTIQIKTPVQFTTPFGFSAVFTTFKGLWLWKEAMVSIRRQRLIKLYGRSPPLDNISSFDNGQSPSWIQNTRHVSVLPTPPVDVDRSAEPEKPKPEEPESSNVNDSSSSNKQPIQHPVFKRRKRHRRKHFENQEPCIMRGVYYKNMKWQAAIKVDKKQIHLGTVGSQEEAARLYDRAAFMCGREPNFELTMEEKDELSKMSWDDFLIMTRSAINSKKHQRRVSSRMKFEHPSQDNSDLKNEADERRNSFSGSEISGS